MAITIPDRTKVRPTVVNPRRKPNAAKLAMVNPGPVFVSKTGAAASGTILCEPRSGVAAPNTREGYYGYNVASDVPAGPNDEAYSVVVGCPVEGFAGVEPGKDVFIDPTAAPDPIGVFSGLTHTVPDPTATGGRAERIGVGGTTGKIEFLDV